jgi:hypothetical protein
MRVILGNDRLTSMGRSGWVCGVAMFFCLFTATFYRTILIDLQDAKNK